MEEKIITVENGLGTRKQMSAAKYPEMAKGYEELRKLAESRGDQEMVKAFTLRIVKE